MARSLICFDDNHISVNQFQMTYIRNLPVPPSHLIEPYLRDVDFSHVALVGRGCKLDPTLVSALVERWRPEMHTFHLSCNECTMTLKDMQLQIGLLVDGSVVIGSVHAVNWRGVYAETLGRVLEMIFGGWIEMGWLRRNFDGIDKDSTEVQRKQHSYAYILLIVSGIIMPDKSRNLVYLKWWNHGSSYARLPNELRDIQLLLDQQLEVEHVKVPLVVYATMEMHMSDRVLRKSIITYDEATMGAYTFMVWRSESIISTYSITDTDDAPPPVSFIFGPLSLTYYTSMPLTFLTTTIPTTMYRPSMFRAPTESLVVMPLMYETQNSYTPIPMVSQTPPGSLFYQYRSSFQPSNPRSDDTRWQSRSNRL
ncbi:hypothetical protein Goari_014545 [Gossypium aridum]|uniref:Aminotransferase-like plant mobile domain-containing protein n=1 Tax=Gossypium aridum TaxID=34290 RepID=A0A7J8XIH0_GOSAI|nr:hypothetical protein [Gossypium aridum]